MDDLDAEWLAFQNQTTSLNQSNYINTAIKPADYKKRCS